MNHGSIRLFGQCFQRSVRSFGPCATALILGSLLLAGCGSDRPVSQTPPPIVPPPSVTAMLSVPTAAQAGTPIAVDASASSSSVSAPLSFGIDFGDGTRGGVAKLAKIYAEPGTYLIALTVLDNAGRSASMTQQITVSAGPAPGPIVQVQGVVNDITDAPLAGVTATLINGTASATSDALGKFSVAVPTVQGALIKLSKAGYADQFVPLTYPSSAGQDAYFLAHMLAREPAQTLDDATQGGTLTAKDGAKFTVGGSALSDSAGKIVSGVVQVSMTPVDISKNSVLAFPGQFGGITADATRTNLVSYGTVEFTLTQNGNRLQLAPGKSAVIEIPAYANAGIDGTALAAGISVPLWSLDETTGQWVQEGTGIVVASANSPTGWTLQATVGHFSWWNMDAPIDGDYQPKPKCQDSGVGVPGSVDHLADATICNLLAQFGSAGVSGGAHLHASSASAAAPILPSFGGTYIVPIAGGVSIALPANQSMQLHATALNGTWVGQASLMGAAAATPDIIIPMNPVQSAVPTEAITLPFDQSRTLGPGQTTRLSFTATGDKPVSLDLSAGQGSNFTGQARLLQGTTVIASVDIGNLTAILNSSLLPAGNYIIEIVSTSSQSGTFALQATYVHWISQGPALRGLYMTTQAPFQLGFAYDVQNRPVVMDSENYNPNNDPSTTNGRYLFNRLVNGQWVAAADPVDIGSQLAGPRNSCVAFALDQAGNPAYLALNADLKSYSAHRWSGTVWQTVGPNNGTLPPTRQALNCVNPPVLLFDATDQPFVAVDASTGQSLPELVVMKFDGTQWLGVGPNNGLISPPNAQNALGNYAMALDSTGKPVVEWNVNTGTAGTSQPAYVLRYQDSPTPAWVGVGSASGLLPSPSGPDSYDFILATTLALDAHDQPILAAGLFMNSGSKIATLAAYQFDGSKWLVSDQHSATQAGQVVPAAPFTQSSNIGITHNAANQLVVAWTEIPDSSTGYLRYYVQTWTGTAWQGLGSTDGLVDNPASPRLDRTLRLAQDAQGNYSIAYFQNPNGTNESYFGVSNFVP